MRRHLSTVLIAFGTAALTAAGPAIAASVVDYAQNADKVDGRHAVGAARSAAERAGKLVATDAEGRLPNAIIERAPDANRLDGISSGGFVQGRGVAYTYSDVLALGSSVKILENEHFYVRYLCPENSTQSGSIWVGAEHRLMTWWDYGDRYAYETDPPVFSFADQPAVAAGQATTVDVAYGDFAATMRLATVHSSSGCRVSLLGMGTRR